MPNETQVVSRLPAWYALSRLFIDAEFDELACRAVVERLCTTSFTIAALDTILRDEVAPAFHRNVCGRNETGWKPAEVLRLVLEHLARRERLPVRLAAPLRGLLAARHLSGFDEPWERVQQEMRRRGSIGVPEGGEEVGSRQTPATARRKW